ncbi:MAG: hypothetical protein K8S99_09705 [Planctomycetes bacterium]|nr:hypothetical protein [Planctomycetota bacterium]
MSGQRRIVIRTLLTLTVVAAAAALFLPLRAAGAPAGADLAFGPGTTPPALLSDLFISIAYQSIMARQPASRPQYETARILFDAALSLVHDDPELWLMRRELATRLEDPVTAHKALGEYCKLVPGDDSAQLTFILEYVQTLQTIDQRVAAVERLLDSPSAGKLNAPLRSRLAGYVAGQLRETGDVKRMASRLKQALELDAANADAAKLFVDWLASRNASSVERGVAMLAYVKASPVESNARWLLGNLLYNIGAYDLAAEQFMTCSALSTGREEIPDAVTYYFPWATSLLAAGRLDDAAKMMDELEAGYVNAAQAKAAKEKEAKEKAGEKKPDDSLSTAPAPSADQPSEVPPTPASPPAVAAQAEPQLPLQLEFINYLIRERNNQKDRADGAYSRVRALLIEAAKDGKPESLASLAWNCVFSGRDVQLAEEMIAKLPEETAARLHRVRGWIELRKGRITKARELFAVDHEEDAFSAYGMALTLPAQSQRDDRAQALQDVIDRFPASLPGALAARDLVALSVKPKPNESAAPLIRLINSWPASLRSPNLAQYPWILMTVKVDPDHYGYAEPIWATVTVRNMTDMPLALGHGEPIASQVLIAVAPRRAGEVLPEPPPMIVDVNRHLRIEPRQSVEVKTRIDRQGLGMQMMTSPTETMNFSLTAVLDPTPSPKGGAVIPGPLGAITTTNIILREGMPLTQPNLDQWVRWLGPNSDPVDRMRALAILSMLSTRLGDTPDAKETAEKMVGAVNGAFDKLSEIEQAWTVAFLPPTGDGLTLFKPVHDAALRSKSRLVQLIYMSHHVRDAESPALTAAMRSEDKDVSDYAHIVADVIKAGPQPSVNPPDASAPAPPAP